MGVPTLEEAIEKLEQQRCPIDDTPTELTMDFDSTWLVFERCAEWHEWRMRQVDRDTYAPDEQMLSDYLEDLMEDAREGAWT